MRAANLALKFGLELAAVAAFAYSGTTLRGTATSALVAVAAPLVAIVLWGTFAAPRSARRLGKSARIPFELAVFVPAALALLAASASAMALIFAVLVVVNSVLLARFDQWEQ